ncbi:3'-5' exonuclease [Sulfuriferula plumbiphila]|nr:3'-5' exonuclease [Sulfuriferula plumbiphila]
MPPILVFDIETVPDTDGLRTLYRTGDSATPQQLAEIAFLQRRQTTGSDFLQLHLQRVVAISCVLRERDQFRVWSLGDIADSEAELIQRFFDAMDKYAPQLVSWNGGGFDLPVLHYRGLINHVAAPRCWDMGEDQREFRYNSYLSRYHRRHLDLMDVLAMYQPRAHAPLDDLARLCGFPGKPGMDGSQVWDAYQAGHITDIRNYCETDAVNIYLVYLRFQQMRGALSASQYTEECALVRESLRQNDASHWREYLGAWPHR